MSNACDEIDHMSCHQIEPHIVDLARGVTSDETLEARLARHVLGCPSCAGRLEQERAMSAALRRLAKDLEEPAAEPQDEQALLAVFDRAVARRSSRHNAPVWTWLAAASVAFAAVLAWQLSRPSTAPRMTTAPLASVVPGKMQAAALETASGVTAATPPISTHRPSRRSQAARPTGGDGTDSIGFVAWPDAAEWPPFESGELIRIDIPTADGVVQADVLVGQDGFARAVRWVQ
jgi:hypothetical protein